MKQVIFSRHGPSIKAFSMVEYQRGGGSGPQRGADVTQHGGVRGAVFAPHRHGQRSPVLPRAAAAFEEQVLAR